MVANGDTQQALSSLERAMRDKPAPQATPTASQDQPGFGSRLLIGMGAGFKNFGENVREALSAGGSGAAAPGTGMPLFSPSQRQDIQAGAAQIGQQRRAEMQQFAETPVGQSGAGKVGKFAGEVLPTVVIPGGAVGSTVRKMLTGAAAGGGAGFMQPVDTDDATEQRILNTLSGTLFGAAVPGLIDASKWGIKAAGGVKDAFTRSGGRKSVVEAAAKGRGADAVREVSERAKRLETFVSPGEATNFKELVARERGMMLTEDLMSELGVTLRNRDQVLTRSIKEVVEEIAPDDPARAQLISEGYDALAQTRFSPKLMASIEADPVLGREYPRFLRAQGYREKIAELPEDSMARLDSFQKYLGEKARRFRMPTTGKGEAAKVVEDKRQLVRDLLDTTVPEYAVARREAQLNILRRNMEQGLDKIKGVGKDADGNPVTTPVQFYQKFLKSDESYDELIENLAGDHPGTVRKLTDLRTVLGSIEGTPLEKVFRVQEPLQTVRTGGFGPIGVAVFEAVANVRQQYNRGILEAITDPAIADDVFEEAARLAAEGTPEAISASLEALTAGVTRALAKDAIAPGEEAAVQEQPQQQEQRVPSLLRAMQQ